MNRRMRDRTYGGVRGRGLGAPSYSISAAEKCRTEKGDGERFPISPSPIPRMEKARQ